MIEAIKRWWRGGDEPFSVVCVAYWYNSIFDRTIWLRGRKAARRIARRWVRKWKSGIAEVHHGYVDPRKHHRQY